MSDMAGKEDPQEYTRDKESANIDPSVRDGEGKSLSNMASASVATSAKGNANLAASGAGENKC